MKIPAIGKLLMAGMLLVAAVQVSSPALGISPYDDVLLEQGRKDLAQGNYEEAQAALSQAWEKGTKTPEKAFLLGVAYRRMMDYPKSRQFLEEALRLKPNYPEARRLLADTFLGLEKVDDAVVHLKELEKIGYQPGQTAYLLGMAAVKQKRYREALDYFQKAQQDPAVAQDAKFQSSMVLASQNRLQEARKTLDEVMHLGPGTDTATFAQRYALALDRQIKETRPFRAFVNMSIDYDSNVTAAPGDPGAAAQVSGRGDMAYTYGAALEYNFFTPRPFTVLTQYIFSQTFHPRITTYDTLNNTFTVAPAYQFAKGRLWVPFSYYYSTLESDKYYTAYVGAPTYLHLLSNRWGLEVGGRLSQKYYWFPVTLPQDNRTALNSGASLGLYYFLPDQAGYLLARLVYEHDWANGGNWSNSSYRLFLSALFPLFPRVKVATFLDFILQPYENPNISINPAGVTVVGNKRYDKIMTYGIIGTLDVYKGLEFNIHYYLVRDDSNVRTYDYWRHIVGCQFGYRY